MGGCDDVFCSVFDMSRVRIHVNSGGRISASTVVEDGERGYRVCMYPSFAQWLYRRRGPAEIGRTR